jgi:uncharacterized protein Veg
MAKEMKRNGKRKKKKEKKGKLMNRHISI